MGDLKKVACQAALRSDLRSQKSSKRPLNLQQRSAVMALEPRTVQLDPARLRRVPMATSHPACTSPVQIEQDLCMELGIVHPLSVGMKIVRARRASSERGHVAEEGRQEGAELSGIEFFLASFGPRIRSCICGAVERFSEITPVWLGMKAVHDQDGFSKLIAGYVPDPAAPSSSPAVRGAWQKRRREASRQAR
jgi:hypothetical protein